jgi:hypothetical protein
MVPWCVHFVITITQIPVGRWLLFDRRAEIKEKVFTWGDISAEQIRQYETALRHGGSATSTCISPIRNYVPSRNANVAGPGMNTS